MIKLLVVTLFCVAVINAQGPFDGMIDVAASAAKQSMGAATSFIPGMGGLVRRVAERPRGPPMRPPPPEQE